MKVFSLTAREILDSRGAPTIEVVLKTDGGLFKASCPSGTSTGKYEAVEVIDQGKSFGRGVQKPIQNLKKIAGELVGREVSNQEELDEILIGIDGTENKSRLGTNVILPVSVATCRALACEKNRPLFVFIADLSNRGLPSGKFPEGSPRGVLPRPCFNILEGGKHASNNLSVQEFMIIPYTEIFLKFQSGRQGKVLNRPQLKSFGENYQAGKKIYQVLKDILVQKFGETGIALGMESGFAPPLTKTEEGLDFLRQAICQAGYEGKVMIGLDIAASELGGSDPPQIWEGQTLPKYDFDGQKMNSHELLSFYEQVTTNYPILFLEDPFDQDDEASWRLLTTNHPRSNPFGMLRGKQPPTTDLLIVGDDLTTTNPERVKMAKEQGLCNGVIIKPNQIGTVSQAIKAAKLAQSYGWKIIVSHRSGETSDDFIADFAVGIGADFIKSGAPWGQERVAKYNRLLEIEKEIGNYSN